MQANLTTAEVLGSGELAFGAGLRDAVVAEIGGRTFVYLVTGSGGGLTALELLADGGLVVIDEMPLSGDFTPGFEPRLLVADFWDTPMLLLSGQSGADARSVALGAGGGFGTTGTLGDGPTELVHPVNAEGPDGTYLIAVGPGGDGLQTWAVTGGALAPANSLADTSDLALAGISDTAAMEVEGQGYVIAVSAGESALSVLALGVGGALMLTGDIGAADGLGLSAPAAVETASVAGRNFAVVAGAGSNSLTVIEVTAGGVPATRDHVVDALPTRFQGVEALAVHEAGGRSFVIAGGADDGLSLFALAPTGRLIHLESIEDSLSTTLSNVSALVLADNGSHLQIIAAGLGETGLTRFELSLAGLGETLAAVVGGGTLAGTVGDDILAGSPGADTISGGAGDDVVIDGGGSDILTGGKGADLFVFDADGQVDTVTDFEPGIDRLDLSAFPMLYHPSHLTALPQDWGVRLIWRDETIDLYRAGGGTIDISGWTAADILDLDRPQFLPIAQTLEGTGGDDTLRGGEGDDMISGGAGIDWLYGEGGADLIEAGTGNDFVFGGTGDDRLHGNAGFDTIRGGDGDDLIRGGNEADTLYGDDGNDQIRGEQGVDTFYGGDGDDSLWGGSENDRLFGGAGNDTLYGGTQEDRILGGAGDDTLYGGAGFDRLEGGPGNDILFGGNQADNLLGGHGNDVMRGEGGFDRLFGGDGDDWGDAGDGPDALFGERGNDTLHGGAGEDRLFGGVGNDMLSGGPGDDNLQGGAGFDVLDGGVGNDILTGNFNADTFVFVDGHGDDIITDFEATNPFEKIDLSDLTAIVDFDDLFANHIAQVESDMVINAGGGDRITALDVALGDLDAGDFIF